MKNSTSFSRSKKTPAAGSIQSSIVRTLSAAASPTLTCIFHGIGIEGIIGRMMVRTQMLVAIILSILQNNALAFAPIGGCTRGVSVGLPPASFAGRSATSLLAGEGPQFGEPGYEGDPTGLKRGAILLPIVLLVNIWMFSIPTEFRRARICSEQQVRENPSSKCMTARAWQKGVADYYANGGGIKFDFSVDPDAATSATRL